jgi:hypothetical protein
VRWVFREYLARDVGCHRLAAELNRDGRPFPTHRGRKEWTHGLVRCILTNPQYTGDLHYNHRTGAKYHRTTGTGDVVKHQPRRTPHGTLRPVANAAEDHIVSEGAHPPIIDRVTFEAARRKLAARRCRREKPKAARGEYPFSGVVLCGDCGECMYGLTVVKIDRGKRYSWRKYRCAGYMKSSGQHCRGNSVHEGELLDKVAAVIEERFSDPATLAGVRAEILANRRRQDKGAEKKAKAIRKRQATLDAQVAQGNRNLALAKTPKDFERVSAAIAEWESEREGLEKELEALEQAAQADEQDEAGLDDALALLQEFGAVIREADPARQRDVVRGLVEKVELRFEHRTLPSGRVFSKFVGGDIHLRGDLGCSVLPSTALRNVW